MCSVTFPCCSGKSQTSWEGSGLSWGNNVDSPCLGNCAPLHGPFSLISGLGRECSDLQMLIKQLLRPCLVRRTCFADPEAVNRPCAPGPGRSLRLSFSALSLLHLWDRPSGLVAAGSALPLGNFNLSAKSTKLIYSHNHLTIFGFSKGRNSLKFSVIGRN